MTPAFAPKLVLSTQPTNISAQKIDGFLLKIYDMIMAGFSIQDELVKIFFFEENFFLADTSMDVIRGMPFLFLGNMDIQLVKGILPGEHIVLLRPYIHRGELSWLISTNLLEQI